MTKAWWCVGAHRAALCCLLVEFGALDDVFDDFFLRPPLFIVTPPHWPLVFALETKVSASTARRFSFITLLPSQATCEAPCKASVSRLSMRGIPASTSEGWSLPDRERRCIFAACCCCFAALAAFVVPTMVEDCLVADGGADEEDMDA